MIVVGKLVDGTEIIGELIGETENGVQIANPLQIVYKYTTNSVLPAVSFARFMMFAKQQEFDFQKVDFMILAEAVAEMEGVYRKLLVHMKPDEKQTKAAMVQGSSTVNAEMYEALLQALEPNEMTKQ